MFKLRIGSAAMLAIGALLVSVQPANATTDIFLEEFGPSWVPGTQWALAEGASYTAQVVTDANQTPNSALRLTPAAGQKAGGLLYKTPVPTDSGLDMSFHFSMWGCSGANCADGINFFLQKGTETSSRMPPGGTLGYSADRNQNPNLNGLNNGLVGIGFDMFGNHGNASFDGTGCPTSTRPGANSIVVRGPGNLMAGYCILSTFKQVADTTTAVNTKWDNGASTRAGRARSVRIVLDEATVSPRQLKIWLCAAGQECSTSATPAVAVNAPAELIATPTVRFGFAASTGGYVNNHEIWGLRIRSQVPVTYSLSYDLGGGTGTAPASVTGLAAGATTTLAAGTGLTRTGFTFGGWTCDNSIGDKNSGTALTQPASNVVCTAKWVSAYSLSYDLGGGTGTAPASVTELAAGATTTLAAGTGLTRTGFTFGGWTCDNSIGDKNSGTALTQPASNVVCTAKWVSAYSLSYDLGGGTGTAPASVTGLAAGATTTLAAGTGLTRTGFTFGGWTCDNSIGDKNSGTALTQPASNVVCTAKWVSNPSPAKNDSSTGRRGERQVIEPLKNDVVASTATWAPGSLRLCGPKQVAPNCTQRSLTVDGEGTYTVSPNNKVSFVPTATFTGKAAKVGYQVADSKANVVSAKIGIVVAEDELPATGSNSQTLILAALMAIMFGGVLVRRIGKLGTHNLR